jgi:yecA family protein
MRLYAQTVQELDDGTGVTLYVFADENGENDLATWSEGYLEGVLLSEADWLEHGEQNDVEELLFPFMLLSGRMREAAEEAGDPLPSPMEERELLSAAAESLGDSVLAVYQYWLDKRIAHAPIKRGGPKVGRNDPCPCGSGKKYKSCHGSSDTN